MQEDISFSICHTSQKFPARLGPTAGELIYPLEMDLSTFESTQSMLAFANLSLCRCCSLFGDMYPLSLSCASETLTGMNENTIELQDADEELKDRAEVIRRVLKSFNVVEVADDGDASNEGPNIVR